MAKDIWKPRLMSTGTKLKLKRFVLSDPLFKFGVFILLAFLIGFFLGRYSTAPEPIIEVEIVKEIVEKEVIIEKEVEKIVEVEPEEKGRLWKITADKPLVIGEYGNNIQTAGEYIRTAEGSIEVNLDAENNIGSITVNLDGPLHTGDRTILDGDLDIEFKTFTADNKNYRSGGIAQDLNMFGNTKRIGEYLPTTHAFVAAFGSADLKLDDQDVYTNMKAVFMYSEGNRRSDRTIRNKDGKIYKIKYYNETGYTEPDDRELHLIIWEDYFDGNNFPKQETFLYLVFEDPVINEYPSGAKI